jgi:hypothetical protein
VSPCGTLRRCLLGCPCDAGRLHRCDRQLEANSDDDYITVDFSLFAELDDGRRLRSGTVYSEGGTRVGWGIAEGRHADLLISRSSLEEFLKLMIGPGRVHERVWHGVLRQLEEVGINLLTPELFVAPFRLEIEPQLADVLTS